MENDLQVREATGSDYETFARFFPELKTSDPLPPRTMWETTFAPRTIFLERGGVTVAYALSRIYGEAGYVSQIVVAPEVRGQGIGRRLMSVLAGRFRTAGCGTWELNVKEDNDAALCLYESVGMSRRYRGHAFVVPFAALESLPSVELEVRPVSPGEQAALETQFGLIAGGLTAWRGSGAVALQGVRVGAAVGVLLCTPQLSSVFPFRARGLESAGSLLRAVRPHIDAANTEFHLFVEDDEPLAEAVRAAGARTKFVAAHLKGPLPER